MFSIQPLTENAKLPVSILSGKMTDPSTKVILSYKWWYLVIESGSLKLPKS